MILLPEPIATHVMGYLRDFTTPKSSVNYAVLSEGPVSEGTRRSERNK